MEVRAKARLKGVLQEVTGGLRSACAYVGADRLKDLFKCCTFVRCARRTTRCLNEPELPDLPVVGRNGVRLKPSQ